LIPSWALSSTTGPVYTMATSLVTTTVSPVPTTGAVALHGGPQAANGLFYGGAYGPLFYGAPLLSRHFGVSPSSGSALEQAAHGASLGIRPPRFYKLEFTTYDGAEDPLN
jgi:hypothetical protein